MGKWWIDIFIQISLYCLFHSLSLSLSVSLCLSFFVPTIFLLPQGQCSTHFPFHRDSVQNKKCVWNFYTWLVMGFWTQDVWFICRYKSLRIPSWDKVVSGSHKLCTFSVCHDIAINLQNIWLSLHAKCSCQYSVTATSVNIIYHIFLPIMYVYFPSAHSWSLWIGTRCTHFVDTIFIFCHSKKTL